MKCPECKHTETKVMESRDLFEGESIRRRRECLKCSARFTTYERFEVPTLVVIKKDGRREQFSRAKISRGIYKACEKREIPQTIIESVISGIEKKLRTGGYAEISSKDIGEIVLEELAKIDDVSYIRFASVYQSFIDIKSFQSILNKLNQNKIRQENE